jgi:hypothetical protein
MTLLAKKIWASGQHRFLQPTAPRKTEKVYEINLKRIGLIREVSIKSF